MLFFWGGGTYFSCTNMGVILQESMKRDLADFIKSEGWFEPTKQRP